MFGSFITFIIHKPCLILDFDQYYYLGLMCANHSAFKTLLLIIAALVVVGAVSSEQGVMLGDEVSLDKVLAQHEHVVVFLSQDDCKYCSEFLQIYTLVAKLYAGVAVFVKLGLTPKSQSLFQKLKVESTPTVLAYSKGKLLEYRYEPMGSGNTLSVQFFKWVERLFLPMKQWNEEENHSHQLIVHCHSDELTSFWREVERNQLWLDVYCGNQKQLSEHLVVVHEYGRRVEAWQLDNDNFSKISAKVKRLIKAYKYKYILNWNTAVIQEVFKNNVSALVLLTNNESLSHHAYTCFQDIKRRWYENSHNYQPTIFAVSDLSLKTYQTLKLKHYLTGYAPFSLKQYFYPILGFISRGTKEGKYLVDLTIQKNKTVIEDFVASVNEHLIKGNDYKEGEEELKRWFSEDKEIVDELAHNPKESQKKGLTDSHEQGLIKILTQQNWKHLLDYGYNKPFFVYCTWRFDYKMLTLETQLSNLWKNSLEFSQLRERYKIFLHLPHLIDLPFFEGLSLEYLPTLLYFDQHKQITKLEGVTDLSKISKFINQIHLNSTKQVK